MRAATGVEATVAALAKSLPCPASILPDFLVAFASTDPKRIDEMVLAIQTDKSPVLVRTRVVYEWLRALKALNPAYANVEIDDSMETHQALADLPRAIINGASLIVSAVAESLDRRGAEEADDVAQVRGDSGVPDLPNRDQQPLIFLLFNQVPQERAHPSHSASRVLMQTLGAVRSTNGTKRQRPTRLQPRPDRAPWQQWPTC